METTPEGMTSTKVYEVGKYVTLSNHINTVEGPTINEAFFQGLPPDVKKAIEETMKEIIPWQRKTEIEINEKAIALLEEKGCELIEINREPLRKAMKSCWQEYVNRSKRGQELIDKINALR
jgi:C4-dicarboxylate-binding protein DctP